MGHEVFLSCYLCHYRTQLSCELLGVLAVVVGWPGFQVATSCLMYVVYKWLRCTGCLPHEEYARLPELKPSGLPGPSCCILKT